MVLSLEEEGSEELVLAELDLLLPLSEGELDLLLLPLSELAELVEELDELLELDEEEELEEA